MSNGTLSVRLHVVFGLCQDYAIHEHAGNLHVTRIEHAVSTDALDLRDHEPVGVLGRHRQRKIVERQRFALHGDVAAQVGGGAA